MFQVCVEEDAAAAAAAAPSLELQRSSSFSLSSAVAMCWIGPEFGVVSQFGLVFWFSHQLLGRIFVGEKEICAL
jgi:hypothetical protein